MRKIVVSEFITVDGVIEDPGGQHGGIGGWAFQFDRGPEGDKFKLDEVRRRRRCCWAGDLRGLRRRLAVDDRRGRLRRQDERHAEVRGLEHARARRLE